MSHARLLAGVAVAMLVIATTFVAVGFAGAGIFWLLLPGNSMAHAALMTSFLLLLPLGTGVTVTFLSAGTASPSNNTPLPVPPVAQAVKAEMAGLALHYPLVAVFCAAAIGMADALSARPK